MDNKIKETIKGIKYNYIALNILLISMFMFLVALFIANNNAIRQLSEIRAKDKNQLSELKEDVEIAKNTILDSIERQSENTNNNIIVSIYQNEDIKQKLDEIIKQRERN